MHRKYSGLGGSRSRALGDISRPGLGSEFGVAVDDLVAIARQFGDDRRRRFCDEVVERGVSGAEQIDAKPAQSDHDGLWVEVLACPIAGEVSGVDDHVAAGAQVGIGCVGDR